MMKDIKRYNIEYVKTAWEEYEPSMKEIEDGDYIKFEDAKEEFYKNMQQIIWYIISMRREGISQMSMYELGWNSAIDKIHTEIIQRRDKFFS